MRILHASDIHLGDAGLAGARGFDGGPRHALKAIVDFSIEAQANLIIIAGDLFEHNRVDAATIEFALQELGRAPVPVVILPGNHDCLVPDSIYQRTYFSKLNSAVHIFTATEGERFSFPKLDLAVWGKPHTAFSGNLRPMADVPPRGGERWHIAIAHGHYCGDASDSLYSFQIAQQEIADSGQDYVALGHWPVFRCVCDQPVKACYSGSASETGTVAVVEFLDDGGVRVRCHSLRNRT